MGDFFIDLAGGLRTVVDDMDRELVESRLWTAFKNGTSWYAISRTSKNGAIVRVQMHRLILGAARGQIVDHVDLNGLNNRRSNLRFATKSQNSTNRAVSAANASGYKGVWWDSRKERWAAALTNNQKPIWLGYHDSSEEAARAYDRHALEIWGSYARLNFGAQAKKEIAE